MTLPKVVTHVCMHCHKTKDDTLFYRWRHIRDESKCICKSCKGDSLMRKAASYTKSSGGAKSITTLAAPGHSVAPMDYRSNRCLSGGRVDNSVYRT